MSGMCVFGTSEKGMSAGRMSTDGELEICLSIGGPSSKETSEGLMV